MDWVTTHSAAMQWCLVHAIGVATPFSLRLLQRKCRRFFRQQLVAEQPVAAERPPLATVTSPRVAPKPKAAPAPKPPPEPQFTRPEAAIIPRSDSSSSSACHEPTPAGEMPRPPTDTRQRQTWLCPLCDARMTVGKARQGGLFYGCPQYPLCRGSRSMADPTKASPIGEVRRRAQAQAAASCHASAGAA